MQSLASQFYAFVVTILMGLTIGMFFDFYKVTKGIARPGKVLGYLGDLLFWIISTVTVFFMLLVGNWGEIRLYVVIGVAVGALIYIKLMSGFVIRVLLFVVFLVKKAVYYTLKVLSFTWFVLIYPFILIKKIIIIPVGYLGTAYTGTCRFIRRHVRHMLLEPASRQAATVKNKIKQMVISRFKK